MLFKHALKNKKEVQSSQKPKERFVCLLLVLLLSSQLFPAVVLADTDETAGDNTSVAQVQEEPDGVIAGGNTGDGSSNSNGVSGSNDANATDGEGETASVPPTTDPSNELTSGGDGDQAQNQADDPVGGADTAAPSSDSDAEAPLASNAMDVALLLAGGKDLTGVDWSYSHGTTTLLLNSSTTYTLSGTAQMKIVANPGIQATIVLQSVTINLSNGEGSPLDCTDAHITLVLTGNNTLAAGSSSAGVHVPRGASLTVQGAGRLEATGSSSGNLSGAGIGGGGLQSNAGTIAIASGDIIAKGSGAAAGIGGGAQGTFGAITLPSAGVMATPGAVFLGCQAGAPVGGGGTPSAPGTPVAGLSQITYGDTSNSVTLSYGQATVELPPMTALQRFNFALQDGGGTLWKDTAKGTSSGPGEPYTPELWPAENNLVWGDGTTNELPLSEGEDTLSSDKVNGQYGTFIPDQITEQQSFLEMLSLHLAPLSLDTVPVLSEGATERISTTDATVSFTSNVPGFCYYAVVDAGSPQPKVDTNILAPNCDAGSKTLKVTNLTAGAKDIYIWVKGYTGLVSQQPLVLRIDEPIFAPVLSAGAVQRIDDAHALLSFTSNAAGSYFYQAVSYGAEAPEIRTDTNANPCVIGDNSIEIPNLQPGYCTLYLVVVNTKGEVSSPLSFAIAPPKLAAESQASTNGWFATASLGADGLIAEPQRVDFVVGDTAATALLRSQQDYWGLEENDVMTIGNQSGGFTAMAFYSNGSVGQTLALNTSPDALSGGVVVFVTEAVKPSSGKVATTLSVVVAQMLRYQDSVPARSYQLAIDLYAGMLDEFKNLLVSTMLCTTRATALKNYIDRAEAQFNTFGELVSFEVSEGALPLDFNELRITVHYLAFQTSFTVTGGVIQLPQGAYEYEVFYAAHNKRATGSFTVGDAAQQIEVDFPAGEFWLSHLRLRHDGYLSDDGAGTFFDEPPSAYVGSSYLQDYHAANFHIGKGSNRGFLFARPTLSSAFLSQYAQAEIQINTPVPCVLKSGVETSIASIGRDTFSIAQGGAATALVFKVRCTDAEQGIHYTQTFEHTIERARSVEAVTLTDTRGTLYYTKTLTNSFHPSLLISDTEIVVPLGIDELIVSASAYRSFNDANYLLVDGRRIENGDTTTVPLTGANQDITIQACNPDGSKGRVVTFSIIRPASCTTKITVDSDVELTVNNSDTHLAHAPASVVTDSQSNKTVYTYELAQDQDFVYFAVKDTYYRVIRNFETGDIPLSFEPEFDTGDYLNNLTVKYIDWPNNILTWDEGEVLHELNYPAAKESTLRTPADEYRQSWYVRAELTEAGKDKSVFFSYHNLNHPNYHKYEIGMLSETRLHENSTSRCEWIVEGLNSLGETVQQVYVLNLIRFPTLTADSVSTFEVAGKTYIPNEGAIQKGLYDYEVGVPAGATEVTVGVEPQAGAVEINGQEAPRIRPPGNARYQNRATLPLNGTDEDELVQVVVNISQEVSTTYTFKILKCEEVDISFSYTPEHAAFHFYNAYGQEVGQNADGTYTVLDRTRCRYTLVAYGYVTHNEYFIVNDRHLHFVMESVEPNENIDPDVPADWGFFRGEYNNAVTDFPTATSPEDTVVYWYAKTANLSDRGQVIFANGYLVTTASGSRGMPLQPGAVPYLYDDSRYRIIMLDPLSGKVVAEGITLNEGGTIPLYAEGMLFVTGTNGLVQAFNATPREQTAEERASGFYSEGVKVIEPLWYYRDPLRGMPANPLYYADGYIYANWAIGNSDSALVCLAALDEKPNETHEIKVPTWRWVRDNAFYWAGACAANGVVVVGGDRDRVTDQAQVACLDAATGELLDTLYVDGDVRSTVSYDKDTNRYYFTSKSIAGLGIYGHFYSVGVDKDGKFFDFRSLNLGGEYFDFGASSSTPVIYNGRAYVGAQGRSEGLGAYQGTKIVVINLDPNDFKVAYTVQTKGFPQSSGLVSTAYLDVPHFNPQTGEDETGFVYVYFTENVYPTRISYIIDKPGINAPVETVKASNGINTFDLAPILFDGRGENGQYCISSCTVDAYGTIYLKTDAEQILAIGPRIEKLEVTAPPDRAVYREGQVFKPEGVRIVAHYANGLTRDVTEYMMYPNDNVPLTAGENSVFAIYPYSLYNDRTPNAQLDSSDYAVYEHLDIPMNKIPRPLVSIDINVVSGSEAVPIEEVEAAIDAIGDVDLERSGELIKEARELYDLLNDPKLQNAVGNYEVLLAAEKRYQYLQQLKAGVIPFSTVITEEELTVEKSGSLEFNWSEQEMLDAIAASAEDIAGIEDGARVKFFIETSLGAELTQAERASLDSLLDTHKQNETSVSYSVLLYKQVGEGDKVLVPKLIGTQTITLEFPVPDSVQSHGRIFRMMNIQTVGQTVGGEMLPEQVVSGSEAFVCKTNRFSTFVLTYNMSVGQVIDPPQDQPGNDDMRVPGTLPGNTNPGMIGNTSAGAAGNASAGMAGNVSAANAAPGDAMLSTALLSAGAAREISNDSANTIVDDSETPMAVAGRVVGTNIAAMLGITAGVLLAALASWFVYTNFIKKKKSEETQSQGRH